MQNKYHQHITSEELKKKENSHEWSYQIAKQVLNRRRKKRKYSAFASSAVLSLFLGIFILFYLNSNNFSEESKLEQLFSLQVEETYKEVFHTEKSSNVESIFINGVDSIIDETLSMRD